MFTVGYTDQKAFRKVFRKFTGITANEYRVRYNWILASASRDWFKEANRIQSANTVNQIASRDDWHIELEV